MKLIENISKKLNLSDSEFREKLGISENASKTEILNALGIYAAFDDKNALSEYINSKLENKNKELETLTNEKIKLTTDLENANNSLKTLEVTKQNLKSLVNSEFKKIDFTTKTDFEQINLDELDYSNLKTSILKQAKNLNWEVKETQPEATKKDDDSSFVAKGILMRY
ncbi:hypothetical protein AAW50_03520 [Mycoplasmopsis canis]|uniref:hypothetical protein n=1 Tax=Mycoplasmopsis canis TaxID=29555 RepID=UPI000624A69E|nr:hypothetical protein [Mycoplasmopsis canis]AKF41027.1 hypothetical protein AAW50_01055 [Mycoplasmopsis canis]AKF41458.1 hypothetical protein AAW50_03520 [Mycoplasmopsis canis]